MSESPARKEIADKNLLLNIAHTMRQNIEDEIAGMKAELQIMMFKICGVEFGSCVELDIEHDGNKRKYTVLDTNVVEGRVTIRVISCSSESAIDYHSDRNRHDEGYADQYGDNIYLDEFIHLVAVKDNA